MKKLSFLLLSLLAVTLFTGCNKDDESVNKMTYSSVINCRAIDGDDVLFSQSTAQVELNTTDMTIQYTFSYKDIDGMSHNMTTPAMKMTHKVGSIYTFNTSGAAQASTSLDGSIDISTLTMWFTFMDGDDQIVCTNLLLYAYATTTVTNPDNGNHYSHQMSAYQFEPDEKCETCIMKISNYTPNIAGSIEAEFIQFNGLTITPTPSGYTITADELEPVGYRAHYNITDLSITLDSQCRFIDGSYKCNNLEFKIAGNLFANSATL